jgi:hypothetical protein
MTECVVRVLVKRLRSISPARIGEGFLLGTLNEEIVESQ